MVLLVKVTYNDDSDGSTNLDVMVCENAIRAEIRLEKIIQNEFDLNDKSLREIAEELNEEFVHCSWDNESKTFSWYDNGKGETFVIADVNEFKKDLFQNIY